MALQVGSTGPLVAELQRKLNEKLAPFMATKLVVDGNFGNATKNAVILFQQKNSLVPDGIVGAATALKLGLNLGATMQPAPAPAPGATVAPINTVQRPVVFSSKESFFSKHKKEILIFAGTLLVLGVAGVMTRKRMKKA